MFMSVTMEPAVFMGKNFQNNQNSIVNTGDLSHTEANVRHICEISEWQNKMRSQDWKRLVGKNIHGHICH